LCSFRRSHAPVHPRLSASTSSRISFDDSGVPLQGIRLGLTTHGEEQLRAGYL
jgi:hypothetical protein